MFAIIARGEVIGHSALEQGDPPMGVAFGTFIPSSVFDAFLASVPPVEEDAEVQIWHGLATTDPDGAALDCLGVGLTRCAFDDGVDLQVDVVGIHRRQYEALFPHHVDAYRQRFPGSDVWPDRP